LPLTPKGSQIFTWDSKLQKASIENQKVKTLDFLHTRNLSRLGVRAGANEENQQEENSKGRGKKC